MVSPEPNPETLAALALCHEKLREQIERRVVGQRAVVELLLTTLFAGGHALFVGVPGLAKTLLVSSLAQATALEFARVQFTPDLMPSDITGTDVLEEDPSTGKRSFRFLPGPVFTNLLLADEINRTPPKTQAALLQAMQEQKVSAGGRTHRLPPPFQVFATQNPIEHEGTYPLPEAQLDRFMLEISVGYPGEQDEREIVAMAARGEIAIEAVLGPAELIAYQRVVRSVPVPANVVAYIVEVLRRSRPSDPSCPPKLRELIRWGAGPRAGQLLMLAAQARAALTGSLVVTRDHIRELAPAALGHRMVLSFAAQSRNIGVEEVMRELLT